MGSLRNKVTVITGATSGIGRATAVEFARKGSRVVLAGRREERLREIHARIQDFNGESAFVRTDVTREEDVGSLFDLAENRFGGADILVNCAGRGLQSDLLETSLEEWRRLLDVNLSGVFLSSKEAAKRMVNRGTGGHIITVSSVAGIYGAPHYSAYCASKHGVTGFQRSIKWELRKYGIRVSTVHPFRVNTEFFDVYKKRPPSFEMLSPGDIAAYIVTVASGSPLKRGAFMGVNALKRIFNVLKSVAS